MDGPNESLRPQEVILPRESSIPEIVIPERLAEERRNTILNLLKNPPQVDRIDVLGRSGTLAASGIYDNPSLHEQYHLPPMNVVNGIGNEIWLAYKKWLESQGREDEIPEEGIGDESTDDLRQPFNDWVSTASHPLVQKALSELRSKPIKGNVSILDDMHQSGSVSRGVAPALYRAAYGEDTIYDPEQNRYIFQTSNWIELIIREAFAKEDLNPRQIEFLKQLAKGDPDWEGYNSFDPHNPGSLSQMAHYCDTAYLGAEAAKVPTGTIQQIIDRYGRNLFYIHGSLRSTLQKHTEEVLKK